MAMPRSAVLAVVAVVLVPRAAAEATTSSVFTLLAQLQQQQVRRQATRSGALALLQRSQPVANTQSTERTFHGLDTNSDGVLSRDEIATFATSQGLDAASAKSELALLDTDGDGALNMSEFIGVLSSSDDTDVLNSADAPAAAGAAVTPPQAAAPAPEAMPALVALPAQVAVQQAPQTPAALAAPAPVEGPATLVAASPMAAQSLAQESTLASSSEFVSVRAKQLLASWNKFESDAKHAEAEAAALRAKATEELREAQELTAIADYALMRAKQASVHPAGEEVAADGNTAASA